MSDFRWIGLLVCLSLLWPGSASADLSRTIAEIRSSIVAVGTVKRELRQVVSSFSGTGFVVGDGTRVITNYHVYRSVKDGNPSVDQLVVFAGRGGNAKAYPVQLEHADPVHDLAVFRLRKGELPPMKLAENSFLREGEDVAYTGFPLGTVLGLYPATNRGMISAITPIVIPADSAKQLTPEYVKRIRNKRFEVYQLDGTAYPGNSGSPVYRPETGEVVAVINSVFVKGTKEAAIKDPSGISYAIPVKHVRALLQGNGR